MTFHHREKIPLWRLRTCNHNTLPHLRISVMHALAFTKRTEIMHRLPKSILTAGLILVLLVGYFGVRSALRGQPSSERPVATIAQNEKADKPTVLVRKITPRPHTIFSSFKGRTEANRSVMVRAETAGIVQAAPAKEGQIVKVGDILCQLAIDSRQARISEAEAALTASRLDYEAAVSLLEKGWTTSNRTAALKAARDQAEAALAAARIERTRVQLTAPFAGIFERREAEIGDFLSPGAACGQVVDLDPILIVFEATENQRAQLASGKLATATLSDGSQMQGTVRFVARTADPATRTFRVELEVGNPDFTIAAGLTADIRLIVGETEAVPLTPASLVLHDDGRVGVRYVDPESMVRFSEVDIIDDVETGIWVTGLPADAALLVEGQGFVQEGTMVQALDAEAR